jgi:hypothetical protein
MTKQCSNKTLGSTPLAANELNIRQINHSSPKATISPQNGKYERHENKTNVKQKPNHQG